ncbi:hypothetical protein GCM10027048_01560 [Hymenobacter coalescens]
MKPILLLATGLLLSAPAIAQNDQYEYGTLLQTYATRKDPELVAKTITFINTTDAPSQRLTPALHGFFGALFLQDAATKQAFYARIDDISKPEFKQLFYTLKNANIDSLYAQSKPSPVVNDMNWSSYFATGDAKYLDHLIRNTQYYGERKNLNLFVTASSAMWSLASNAGQYPAVRAYLATVKNKNVSLLLKKDPAYFQQQMAEIVREQQAKGGWDTSSYQPQ